MTIAVDFPDLLSSVVEIYPFLDSDAHGSPLYGSLSSTMGRLVHRQRLVRRLDGSEISSSSFVTIAPVAGLSERAKVVVDGVQKIVASVQQAPDETLATYYQRIFFQ